MSYWGVRILDNLNSDSLYGGLNTGSALDVDTEPRSIDVDR